MSTEVAKLLRIEYGVTGRGEAEYIIGYGDAQVALAQGTGIVEPIADHGTYLPISAHLLQEGLLVVRTLVKVQAFVLAEELLHDRAAGIVVAAEQEELVALPQIGNQCAYSRSLAFLDEKFAEVIAVHREVYLGGHGLGFAAGRFRKIG